MSGWDVQDLFSFIRPYNGVRCQQEELTKEISAMLEHLKEEKSKQQIHKNYKYEGNKKEVCEHARKSEHDCAICFTFICNFFY